MNNYVVSDGARRWDLWDAVASTKFRADVRSKVEPLVIPLVELEESTQRHHTVPMYLWGVPSQQLVPLPFSLHVAVHSMLGKVELAVRDAETYATSVVPFGRRRSAAVRQLCQTMPGRIHITNGIWTVYEEVGDINGLWETFGIERLRYEGGVTTCAGSTL